MNKFETRQVEAAKTLYANNLQDYAASSLAYLTRITKKESTRKEIISLIKEMNLEKYLTVRNNVLVSKVEVSAVWLTQKETMMKTTLLDWVGVVVLGVVLAAIFVGGI